MILPRRKRTRPSSSARFLALKSGTSGRSAVESWMQSAPDAILVHGPEGRILEVNEQSCRSLGYARWELLELGMSGITEGGGCWQDPACLGSLKQGEPVTVEEVRRRKDGSTFPVESRLCLLESGSSPKLMIVFRDISARRRLEDDLRQAQKMEALGRLAGGIAHDFNNLLTVILGFSDMALAQLEASSSLLPYLRDIKGAGESASALTRQLLAFSRRQPIRPKAMDLSVSLGRFEPMLRRLLPETIRLELQRGPFEGAVRVDPAQLDQVMLNLAINARDAMPHGGVLKISTTVAEIDREFASTHSGSAPGIYGVLSVSDTGAGIPKDVLPHLFEPFFTTKPAGAGTGLGLATVFGIVKQSSGFLSVASEAGKGATFRVYLPFHPKEGDSSLDSQLIGPIGGTESVLLVEDCEAVRRFAAQALRTGGHRVFEAAHPAEALRRVREGEVVVDLLLTDMVMPEITGRELARALKAELPRLAVVYMSGYTEDEAVREGKLEAGAGFIPKPFTSADLLVRVRKTLDKAKA